jgi:glyoxalase family protein
MKQVNGIHHVTAITSSAEKIYDFFTNILSMRLVKKTVNQDDIQTYHLFFADDEGNAGTDMTFFDFNGAAQAKKGTNEIAKTSFRVPDNRALLYWKKRFEKYNVKHAEIKELFGIQSLEFEDFDGQEYVLFSDENDQGVKPGIPWKNGPVPEVFGIRGLGPIFFRVDKMNLIEHVLIDYLNFKKTDEEALYTRYQSGLGGNGASVIVIEDKEHPQAIQGYGGVHHVAFRVNDKKDIYDWIQHLNQIRAPHSGEVDRFYFTSLYTRLYPGLLFEFATEGPGFIDDEESYETLGEQLALPPKFRNKREQIENMVRHIDTKRSDKVFEKEFLGFEE